MMPDPTPRRCRAQSGYRGSARHGRSLSGGRGGYPCARGDTVHAVYVDGGLAFSGSSENPALIDYVVDQVGVVGGRRYLSLSQWGGPDQIWIEGFGSPYGLFSQQDPINVSGYMAGIWCMSHQDTTWYYSQWEVNGSPGYSCTPQYVGMDEPMEQSMHAFPNPTSGWIAIGPDIGASTNIVLTDQCGRAITVPIRFSAGTVEIDLSSMDNGFYFATLIDRRSRSTYRILKY